ncbi:thioredoxin family protein [Hymenobacter chitinivorans]|uniref:Thioredoxin-like protein n=1 Tax=Hymenobacter chitinivorans DSM 11115 TaxID=1121954 RepID=A0A2M9BQL5_9BACT|nr:thioredoxin family protein [Hymenobacter chitinivorans]PJJ60239.1 thioredoxin-like protein [Hymenobacter chitinivorans DSM 11115]
MRLVTLLFSASLALAAQSAAHAQAPAATTTAAGPTWGADLTAALQQAKASHKPVLAVFSGSDWCKPCIMLKQEVFDQPEFARFAQDRFVLARFDFPRSKKNKLPAEATQRNEQAAAQLNKEGAFPLVVLLSPEGKVLAKTGYRPGGVAAYDAYLQSLLAKQ